MSAYGSYFEVMKAYFGLLKDPSKLMQHLSDYKGRGWASMFEAWNVTALIISLIVCIAQLAIAFILTFGLIVVLLPVIACSLAFSIFWSWVSWTCVIQNKGCCGAIGYAIWGVLYILGAFGVAQIAFADQGIIQGVLALFQSLAHAVCGISCIMMCTEGSDGKTARAVEMSSEEEASSNESA